MDDFKVRVYQDVTKSQKKDDRLGGAERATKKPDGSKGERNRLITCLEWTPEVVDEDPARCFAPELLIGLSKGDLRIMDPESGLKEDLPQ